MVVPDRRWFPSSLAERRAFFTNFNTNMQSEGASLGFTAAELLQLAEDWETFDFLAVATVSADTYVSAIREYRKVLTEGEIGDPAPDFPADITFSLPFDRPTGIFERLDNIVKRTRVSPAYTTEMGVLLGIIPDGGGSGPEGVGGDSVPALTPAPGPGNVVTVKFIRGSSDGIFIEIKVDNDASWSEVGRYPKSPAVVVIPQNEDHLPRQVQIRARFLDNNDPVGDWSSIETVQTIP